MPSTGEAVEVRTRVLVEPIVRSRRRALRRKGAPKRRVKRAKRSEANATKAMEEEAPRTSRRYRGSRRSSKRRK